MLDPPADRAQSAANYIEPRCSASASLASQIASVVE